MANSTEIGTAYLRVKPKVDNSFERDIEAAGGRAGGGFGGAFQVAVGNILANIAEQAVQTIGGALKDAFTSYADYEQLVGGVEKIFDQMDTSRIFADAQNAYKELNMSANEYMETINQAGAVFAQTMGDEKGYQVARDGMLAISDYASGTGRDLNELNEKFRMISRSSSSYQSIADQFAGILPQTSQDFLEQAQAAGLLSDQYTSLTEVPLAEYQQALVGMLQLGVEGLGLTGNTLAESTETISGSLAMLDSAWSDFLVALFDEDADMDAAVGKMMESIEAVFNNVMPRLQTAARSLFSAIPQALMGVLEESFPGITAALQQIGEAFAPAIESMQRIGAEIAPMVAPALERIGAIANEFLLPAIVQLGESFSGFMEAIEPWMPNLVPLGEFIGTVLVVVISELARELSLALDIVTAVTNAVTDFLEVIGITPESIREFSEGASEYFGDFKENATSDFESAKQKVEDFAETLSGNVSNKISEFGSSAKNTFETAYSSISNAMGNARAAVEDAIETIKGAFNFQISWPHIPLPHFNWHWESIGGMINIPAFDGISWYGMGGFVDDATLIGAGERGGELIWPSYEPYLGRYADAIADRLGGRGGVDIHDCTFVVRREDDIRKVAVQLNTLINRQTGGALA